MSYIVVNEKTMKACRCNTLQEVMNFMEHEEVNVKTRKVKIANFRHLVQYPEPDRLMRRLHELIDGRNGADVGCVLMRCVQENYLMRNPTQAEFCAEFARLSQSRVYENLSFRANVIAYLKAMVLYVAHGEVWTPEMEDFVRWSLRYDMWCKMQFFGEAIEQQNGMCETGKRPGPRNLLDLLPETFTREEAMQMRQRQGIQGPAQTMLDNWKKRGYIMVLDAQPPTDIARQRFGKTEEYLRKHPQPVGQSVNRSVIF